MFQFRKFLKATSYAVEGIQYCFKNQSNFFYQFLFLIGLSVINILVRFSLAEWLIYFGLHGLIIAAEMFNTSLEGLCDLYSTERNPQIKIIKDVAAGAVLVTILAVSSIYLGIVATKISPELVASFRALLQ